jgi:hypothetical protein
MIATLPRGVRRLPVGDDATADPPGDPAPAGDDVAALHVDDSDDSLLTDDATLLG